MVPFDYSCLWRRAAALVRWSHFWSRPILIRAASVLRKCDRALFVRSRVRSVRSGALISPRNGSVGWAAGRSARSGCAIVSSYGWRFCATVR